MTKLVRPWRSELIARWLADELGPSSTLADAFERLEVDAGTTVVVVLPYYLGTSTIERLRDHAADAHALVVVGAGPGVADAFGVPGGGVGGPLAGRDFRGGERARSQARSVPRQRAPHAGHVEDVYTDADNFHVRPGCILGSRSV